MLKNKPEKPVYLADVIYQLSLPRDLDSIIQIVCTAVRCYTGSDGVTFVRRENDTCYYAGEEAVMLLWKGRRFPLSECISGWVMTHKKKQLLFGTFLPTTEYRMTCIASPL